MKVCYKHIICRNHYKYPILVLRCIKTDIQRNKIPETLIRRNRDTNETSVGRGQCPVMTKITSALLSVLTERYRPASRLHYNKTLQYQFLYNKSNQAIENVFLYQLWFSSQPTPV